MATIFKLIIEDDEGKTTVYPLSYNDISIGRKEGNTIRLMERNVSRRHARLLRNNGTIFIEDLDSYNGIRINGERINGRYEVKEGDLVEIGDYHLALQAAELAERPAAADKGSDGARSERPAAGTVPDFRLPEEILAALRKEGPTARALAVPRDTTLDSPAPPAPSAPAVIPAGLPATRTPQLSIDAFGLDRAPPSSSPGRPARSEVPKPSSSRKDEPGAGANAVGPARVAQVPRLICVSTSYAGREFPLNGPELVIGRVEDNDIVIEHRSVSRNHAKVLFDGRVHKIIDLQSANGILVNGEEYAMTDLRRGDLIELGHVKFRFIPSGDTFSPSEEEVREMREAGVQPPTLESLPPEPALPPMPPPPIASPKVTPHKVVELVGPQPFDLSNAATVTDTPISALAFASPMPAIESGPSFAARREVVESRPRPDGAGGRSGLTSTPSGAAGSGGATGSDSRSSDLLAAPPARASGSGTFNLKDNLREVGGGDALSRRGAPPELDFEPPKSNTHLIWVFCGLAVVAVAAAVVLRSNGDQAASRADPDSVLSELVRQQSWVTTSAYCEENRGRFADPARAQELCQRAEAHAKMPPPASAPVPDPQPPAAIDSAGDAGAQPGAKAGASEGLEPEPEGDADAIAGNGKVGLRNRPAPKGRKDVPFQAEAARALFAGHYEAARKPLLRCVELNPANPECNDMLGRVYEQAGDKPKAAQFYRHWKRLKPDGDPKERERVQRLIDDTGSGAPP